ncbi:MAG TPA: hypothetical protein ENH23_03740 [candidate division Zixibacteria bacterium]|nr:hypothetical protein [candidate division Zixibacteria bacterium]
MKRQIPFVLVFLAGAFMAFQYYVPHESSEFVYEFLLDWTMIIGIFALALGIWSLYQVSVDKIKLRKENWAYSYVTLIGLFIMVLFGFTYKIGDSWGMYSLFVVSLMALLMFLIQTTISKSKGLWLGLSALALIVAIAVTVFDDSWGVAFMTSEGLKNTMFTNFADFVLTPILSTMFSLLAFFIASAAYRAFRARNVLASLLLIAALIVMLRFNPYMPFGLPDYMMKISNWLMNVPNLAAQRAIVIGIGLGIVATSLKVILGIERGYMGKG